MSLAASLLVGGCVGVFLFAVAPRLPFWRFFLASACLITAIHLAAHSPGGAA